MTRRTPRRLQLRRETLRRLADGDLARAAGGLIGIFIQRCTYEKSGCYGQTDQTSLCNDASG
ncbi:MAG TPA: hypothetical protein VN923_03485, partial [Thermoanaerobaculia bacterium]|nr:hypothetical protein [Thermoanaerobaculia bacterium]